MKRFLTTAALAFSVVTASSAIAQMSAPQDGTPQMQPAPQQRHAPNPQRQAQRIGQQLNLSPDQTARLEPILADRQQKVMALRANTSLTDAQRKQQMHVVQLSARQQMASVLSPEQMKQLKKMHHKTAEDRGGAQG